MARDSDRMDLHADDVLFGRENDVFGFEYSTMSNVNPGVSFSETLIGDVGGINSSMGLFSGTDVGGLHMNSGCNFTINRGEKEGFYQEKFNGLADGGMLGVADRGCDGKVGKFSHGPVQNEDERTVIQSTGGGCAVSDKDLVFGLNDGVQIEQDCENAANVAEASLDMENLFSRKAFLSDAQVNAIQNYMQYSSCGLDLVVDFNFYKNAQEGNDSVPRDSVFSDVNFRVSDLVWGKVSGHPWWPGQIYDPSVASETVKSYWEEDCYLIAYFGSQKFAWNEVSTIKPFYKHFSEMAKQTDCESFRFAVYCALEEASRQVALGLSCPCLPKEASSNLKTEVVANAEICKQSFEPAELLSFVQSLAQSPLTEFDRLDLVSARGQVSAFYRSKGYSQLPEFAVHDRLFVPDMEILPVREEEQCNDQVLQTDQCFLPDLISEKNLQTPWGEFTLEKKAGDNITSRRGRKRKTSQDPSYDCFQDDKSTSRRGRKRKTSQDPPYDCLQDDKSTSRRGRKPKAAYKTSDDCFQNFQTNVNNSIPRKRGRKPKLACNTYDNCFNNSQTGNSTEFQNASVDDMWSQLCFAAKDPAGESCYTDMIHYFADFRKVTGRNNSAFLEQGFSLEQKCDGETEAITSIEAAAVASVSAPMDPSSIEATAVASVSAPMDCSIEVASVSAPIDPSSIEAAAVASVSTPMDRSIDVASVSTPMDFSSIEAAAVVAFESTPMDMELSSIEDAAVPSVSTPSIEDAAIASVLTPVDPDSIEAAAVASVSTPIDLGSIEAAVASVSKPMEVGVITSIEAAATATTPMEVCNDSILEEETFLNKQEREDVSSTTGLVHDGNLVSEPFTHVEQQNLRSELLPPDEISFNNGLTHQNMEEHTSKSYQNMEEHTSKSYQNMEEHASKSSPTNRASELFNEVEHAKESSLTANEEVEHAKESSPTINEVEHVKESSPTANEVEHAKESSATANEVEHAKESSPTANEVEHGKESSATANEVEHAKESSPTAFILKFTNFDWGPSATYLNQIFARFGPLIESKTELLERNKCVRVVFKRRIDAENAFSSAGKYSIFGSSLKSYRLKILPPPMPKKATGKKRGRKSKREIASMNTVTV
ncbi:PWWP domain-containing protein 2-like [Vicia villosa]|uniref:PWWP domain-containing protein 2-like n=1 Tax=Vicia villosa TaxID=3911 RepID=UPI00273B83EC|nr:PWWP domain-containing protein 2-like [Vicia villosa]